MFLGVRDVGRIRVVPMYERSMQFWNRAKWLEMALGDAFHTPRFEREARHKGLLLRHSITMPDLPLLMAWLGGWYSDLAGGEGLDLGEFKNERSRIAHWERVR